MNGRSSLGPAWRRWTTAVERLVNRRRHRPDEDQYHALYVQVLDACHLAGEGGNAERRARARWFAELALPWLSTRVFDRSDRDILLDLLTRCRRVDRELNGRRWRELVPAHLWSAAAGAGVALLAAWTVYRSWHMLNDRMDDGWRVVRMAMSEATPVQKLLALGVLILPLTWYLVHHVRRA